jgi:hypothetical protein
VSEQVFGRLIDDDGGWRTSFHALPAPGQGWQRATFVAAAFAWAAVVIACLTAAASTGPGGRERLMFAQRALGLAWLVGMLATVRFYTRRAPLIVSAGDVQFRQLTLPRAGLVVRAGRRLRADALTLESPAGRLRLVASPRPLFWPAAGADAFLPRQSLADLQRMLSAPAAAAPAVCIDLVRNLRRLAPAWFSPFVVSYLLLGLLALLLALVGFRAGSPLATGVTAALGILIFSAACVVSSIGWHWPRVPERQLIVDGGEVRYEDLYRARVLARGPRGGVAIERRRWRGWDTRSSRSARVVKWNGLVLGFPDGTRLRLALAERGARGSDGPPLMPGPGWAVAPGVREEDLRAALAGISW